VEKLLSRQNKVIATTRSPQDASQLQQLAAQHTNLTITQLDTSQPQSIKNWAATVKQHTSHVDVLINNAGMYGRRLKLAEFEADDFMTVFQTNTVGPFLVVQQLLKQGLLGPPGSLVVNVSSIMASHGDEAVSGVTPGGYAYRCVGPRHSKPRQCSC
jgi:NAD(P)-dependent dehydrogenase (short-subunit alcohol dehydrogenase family)